MRRRPRGRVLMATLAMPLLALVGCGSAGQARRTGALVAIGAGLKGPAGLKAKPTGRLASYMACPASCRVAWIENGGLATS